jgi:hypothetical protein
MAAALLFSMVFFVSESSFVTPRPSPRAVGMTDSIPPPQIIMFSDLECDYINPIDLCNKLNQVRQIYSTA